MIEGSGKPREFGIDVGYSRKLTDKVGIGVALRYINSNLTGGAALQAATTYKTGNSVAGDIGFYYDGKNDSGRWIGIRRCNDQPRFKNFLYR